MRRNTAYRISERPAASFNNWTVSKFCRIQPTSSDVAPSDYGLFRSLQHFIKGRRFESFDQVEEACQEFFHSKPKEWYFDQIRKLADRWQKVVDNDGLYFEE